MPGKEFRFKVIIDGSQPGKELQGILEGLQGIGNGAEENFNRMEAAAKESTDELRKIVGLLEKTEKQGDKSFGGIGKGAALAGTGILGVVVAASKLADALANVASAAARMFIDVAKGGVELNKNLEVSEQLFSNLFNDPTLGKETIEFLRQTADALRINQAEAIGFGERILPRTSGLKTFTELLRLTGIQARTTGTSVEELEFSIREALSFDTTSLRDRFDLSRETIERFKQLGKEIGADKALVQILNEEFDRLGKNNISGGTLDATLNDIQSRFTNLQTILGESGFEELKEQAEAFLSVFSERGDDIETAARALGDLVAKFIEIAGENITDFIENFDFEAVEEFADNFIAAAEAANELIQVIDVPEAFNSLVKGASELVELLERSSRAAAQIAEAEGFGTKAAATAAGLEAATKKRIELGILDRRGRVRRVATEAEEAEIQKAADDARATVIGKESEALKRLAEAQEENETKAEDRRKATEETTAADQAAIDAALARQQAEQATAEALEDAAEAQKKISAETTEFVANSEKERTRTIEESNKKRIELERRQEEARTETLIRQSEKRAQLELADAQRRDKALFDFQRESAKAGLELPQEIVKAEQEAADERRRIAENLKNARIQAERDYQNEIRRLQSQFDLAAEDAERANDVTQFLAAQRQLRSGQESARVQRDEQRVDAEQTAKQDREAVKAELTGEIEDLREANKQKAIERERDLQDRLAKLDFQYQQELEKQDLRDQQETDRQDRKFVLELERFDRLQSEKLAKLNASLAAQLDALKSSLDEEFAAIEAAEEVKQRLRVVKAEETFARIQQIQNKALRATTIFRDKSSDLPALPVRLPGPGGATPFADGGRFQAGQRIRVGERGVEEIIPDFSGVVIPNHIVQQFAPRQSMPLPISLSRSSTVNNNNSRNLTVESLNFGEGMPAVQQRMIENIARQSVSEILGGL